MAFYASVLAVVLLLTGGGGYFALAPNFAPQDLTDQNLERALMERRAAYTTEAEKLQLEQEMQHQAKSDLENAPQEQLEAAAAAEKLRLEQEAQHQAEFDLENAQQMQRQQVAAEAEKLQLEQEVQRQAESDLETAEQQQQSAAAEAEKPRVEQEMQPQALLRELPSSLSVHDAGQEKTEEQTKALIFQLSEQIGLTTTPSVIAPSLDAAKTEPELLVNEYDGIYACVAGFPRGTQSFSLHVVNGVGTGSWQTSCGTVIFTLTIDPNGEAYLSLDGFRRDCSKSPLSLRDRVENGRLKFPMRGISGDGVVSFTRLRS